MNLRDGIEGVGKSQPDTNKVSVFDPETKTTTRMPVAELAPGMVEVRNADTDETKFMPADSLKLGPMVLHHPPFEGWEKEQIVRIFLTFKEVFPQTLKAWEMGFRAERRAMFEIVLWAIAADVYEQVQGSLDSKQRREAFKVLSACLTGPKHTVLPRSGLQTLPRSVAKDMITVFYKTKNGVFKQVQERAGS